MIPRDDSDFIVHFDDAYDHMDEIKKTLRDNLPEVRKKVNESFTLLKKDMEN